MTITSRMSTDAERLQAALLSSVTETRDAIDTQALISALERQDHKAILELLGIVDGRFITLEAALSDKFSSVLSDVYESAARGITGSALAAELIQHNQELRTKIISELTAASAHGVANTLDAAIKLSAPAAVRARTITNLIGLTDRQAKSLVLFADGLQQMQSQAQQFRFTSTLRIGSDITTQTDYLPGLPSEVTRFLNASQRSMLNTVSTPEKADKLLRRQAEILIQHRARTAAEFQMVRVQEEAKQQAAARIKNAGEVRRHWVTAGDERVRENHTATSALNPSGVAVNQPFTTPLGPVMNPPLEPGCRCHVAYRRSDGSPL